MDMKPPFSADVVVPAMLACEGSPAGERHLIGVLRRGPHGLVTATVTIARSEAGGAIHFNGTNTMSFESRAEARAFVSAWVWYRVTRRRSQPKGTP